MVRGMSYGGFKLGLVYFKDSQITFELCNVFSQSLFQRNLPHFLS
jgi:hypothetical protein